MSIESHHKDCALFVAPIVAQSVFIFYKKFCWVFPKLLFCKQVKLELLSPEIVSPLENKELLSHFRVYRKSATSEQIDRQISTDRPLYNGE